MKSEYLRIWLLEDFVLGMGIDWGTKGDSKFWKLKKEYDNGDLIVQRGGNRAILFADEVRTGEKHTAPNLSYPTGLHFGIERGYRRTWYGRLKREDQHKLLNREEEKT